MDKEIVNIEEYKKQISAFSTILKRINISSDFNETLVNVMSEIKTLMHSEAILLFLVDTDTRDLYYEISIGPIAGKFYGSIIENKHPIAKRTITTINPIYSNNPIKDPIFSFFTDTLKGDLKNILFMPLKARKKNMGALFLINKKQSGFNDNDVNTMHLLADLTSISITTKVVYDISQLRAYEAGALYQMSIAINKFSTVQEILDENITVISEAFEARRVSIIIKENGVFKFKAGTEIDKDVLLNGKVTVKDNVLEAVLLTGRGVYSVDTNRDTRFSPNKNLRYKSTSFIASPIFAKNEIIGFVCVTERMINKPFRLGDLSLLEMLAQQIGENYLHIVLSDESKIKQTMEAELSVTGNLQKSILPTGFPNTVKFDVTSDSIPSQDVGGDFYDFIKMDNDKYAIIIADVSGKGIFAGLYMTMTRSILRVYVSQNQSPATILSKVNKHIYEDSKSGMFVTCFLAVVDIKKKTITYSNAGHIEQYLLKKSNGKNNKKTIKSLHTMGKPLGFIEKCKYQNKTTEYNSGDTMILFTDGITETFNEKEEEYGYERLKEVILSKEYSSSNKMFNAILKDTKSFQGLAHQFDDITLIVAKLL